jgi:DNA-binding XRE family transcriptional regulator
VVKALNIGLIIKSSRCKHKMSQSDLALKSGVPQTTISDIEHGANPTWSTVSKLSTALNLKIEDLLVKNKEETLS